ncbi:hypothetical protein [Paraferrimonas haliotis]|uniref:Uncharacterized protein n=1 Tax=Paraferrimonas haliotis TaxID=2013866 RepID=A0AA37WWG5_9GAMM|nr:hypothetical protein [Paraferrimonas haliotis]GLS83508.1 hypothetical protein GCM10007894_14850 [Paraferrimonas haliotis]
MSLAALHFTLVEVTCSNQGTNFEGSTFVIRTLWTGNSFGQSVKLEFNGDDITSERLKLEFQLAKTEYNRLVFGHCLYWQDDHQYTFQALYGSFTEFSSELFRLSKHYRDAVQMFEDAEGQLVDTPLDELRAELKQRTKLENLLRIKLCDYHFSTEEINELV